MRKTFIQAAGGLTFALGVAGCGAEAIPPVNDPSGPGTIQSPQAVNASIEHSFERLRALQLVDVNRLSTNLPSEAFACYGVPCPGSDWATKYDAEKARQAPRFEHLATIAEKVSHDASLSPRAMSDAPAAIAALSALRVVDVQQLIEVQPEASNSCYSLVCPEAQAAADKENGLRVARVFAIADEATRSGL